MKKIITGTFVILMFIVSCGNIKKQSGGEDIPGNITVLSVDEFEEVAGNYIGQEVMITGKVTHVCRHGGKRLFITGENPEKTVRITTGDSIPAFSISLEGSNISVKGVLKELIINETYLAEWEAEVVEGTGKEHKEGQAGPDEYLKEQTEMEGGDPLARIKKLRDEITTSGKDHLSDYWIETIEFQVKDIQ